MKKRVVKFNCDPGFFFSLLKEEILHFVDPVFYHPPSFHYFYLPFRPYLHPYHRPFCPRPLCPHHHSFLLYYRPILCNGGVKKSGMDENLKNNQLQRKYGMHKLERITFMSQRLYKNGSHLVVVFAIIFVFILVFCIFVFFSIVLYCALVE